jgi:activator of HSP90 ATPase
MSESLTYSIELPVYPERVYRAWLDGGEQKKISGQSARIDARVGGQFSLLDGRVEGKFLTLTPHDRIVQTWRMADFAGAGGESAGMQIELRFEPTCTGTELRLSQEGIPDGKTREVLQWWEDTFFRPIRAYFDAVVGEYVADMGDG